MQYARVFFEVPLDKGFDYRIPEALRYRVLRGSRVIAPFGSGKKTGYVIELLHAPEVAEVKEILDVPDDGPIFDERFLKLARWIAEYYFCPLGLVLKTMLPAPVRKFKTQLSQKQQEELAQESPSRLENPHILSEEQARAGEMILKKIHEKTFSVTLIHGVTGSGKTELYLLAIAEILKQGKTAMVLVPEISLTPQTVRRVKNRFGKIVALLHSRLSRAERVRDWEKIRSGEARVVVGPRSALFAPLKDLGLVIVDEEHEHSYKQEESPKYHGRDVAIMRAKLEGVVVLLGSATPSMESFYNAEQGRYNLISLTKRVEDRPMPTVRVVDMRREVETHGKLFNFSRSLINAVQDRLKAKEQVIIFLNRRGYAPLVICPSCGHVVSCLQCDQAMTYHQARERLICHLCDFQSGVPALCPKCGKSKLNRLGIGTQRVEAHLLKLFPESKVQRMDTDSTRAMDSHQKFFDAFHRGEIEVLVGTQMVAKGLDFPNVTLVGVMSADVAMSLPDFRMGEHTFQLLTQVAGRSGRGKKLGEVLIQTFTPFHPIIQSAVRQDYGEFYRHELVYRQQLGYPPFSRIISILVDGISQTQTAEVARKLGEKLKRDFLKSVKVVGPHPAPISKLKGRYRWQIILFYPRGISVHQRLRQTMDFLKEEKRVKIVCDVDPVSLI